jgi:hypothetical protein
MRLVLAAVLGAGAMSGCAKARAHADPAMPALAVPSPAEPSATPEIGAPAPSAPALQLAPAGDAASEQNIRRRLVQADRDLQRVDYRLLNVDAKTQYDDAKRMIALAEKAIVDRNLLFAHTLADKAATIAELLQRR